ncbi:MAG TPA: epoxide hydrolase, partial [Enhygromyxa sp.]|nr:epoxide hydrolase [Enhygromyxa sp.]
TVGGWEQGTPLDYVQTLVEYWHKDYDWRRAETLLNGFPNFRTALDGPGGPLPIHFLHITSPHENALPMIMTHGWPGSVIEFHKVIGPLTDPTAHGGSADDAFHLVIPALPGYGFSDKPQTSGWSIDATATAWGQLMTRLGYDRYVAQGGDWGAAVTQAMAIHPPAGLAGIHVNPPLVIPDPDTFNDLTEFEQSALAGMQYYQDWDSGYAKQQSTRPQSLGYGLADSPVGQMAWIIEKFQRWMDCDGHPENVLTRDELLDNVMLYWLTNSGASSARLYWESLNSLSFDPISLPSGMTIFPKELFRSSLRWAEKRFSNILHFGLPEVGGHFAALEQPEIFVAELRTTFASLR